MSRKEKLYRIMTPDQLDAVKRTGSFRPQELVFEGHVYACYLFQTEFVAGLLYNGALGLILLEIDPDKLGCEVYDDNFKGGKELFPHIRGPIPLEAFIQEYPLPVDPDGSFELPYELQAEYERQMNERAKVK